ncbi:MAG: helicase [Planctomycetes bacterium]|nr:helicase [Planctomycetota bacterium]
MRPVFVDNQNGNTLARALAGHLEALRRAGQSPAELCICSAYFNPPGLHLIADELDRVPRSRILLGAEPVPEWGMPPREPGDPDEPEFTRRQVHRSIDRLEAGLRRDRDLLPFDRTSDQTIRRMLALLTAGKIEVRIHRERFLHAKAFLVRGSDGGVLVGSSNLTRAGMVHNLELNLGHYDPDVRTRVGTWYDQLWEQAESFDLAAIYEEMLGHFTPYEVYLKVLWQLYHGELEQEEEEPGHIPVTNFQKHGVWRARRILEKYGGVLIADGVGLGKTFTAGEIIRVYRERRQRVLLVCPAALRDTSWKKFLHNFQLLVEVVSYEQLARERQLGGQDSYLQSPLDDYALVVVDEAHNYRNPDAPSRAAILRRLLSGRPRHLVLLSATPVNNSLWDLFHVLRYFLRQDAALADRGVRSLQDRFDHAMRIDPFNLHPDVLYPVIDATTVKRTRRFVRKYYENDQIRGPGGTMQVIRFPRPVASTIHYDLEARLPGFFDRLEEILMPPSGTPLLTMARYQADRYLTGAQTTGPDSALVGLLRSALLKRFESSSFAFVATVGRMIRQHEVMLEALGRGLVVTQEFFDELAADADDEVDELLQDGTGTIPATSYDVPRLTAAVQGDLHLLQEMHEAVAAVKPGQDPKLKALIEELRSIAASAASDAMDDEDARQKRKVLVFSHYAETIDWIEGYLSVALPADDQVRCYAERTASVAGNESRHGVSRDAAVFGFAPVSTDAPADTKDRFDLLLCTDVLAEGMNLQQCRNIINYDLPWNPMRLVQRHGRVDRIGSPHPQVFLRTFFPARQLDDLLDLEGRVRSKLAQAAASVGVEDSPIEGGRTGDQAFADSREEIERLERGDASIYEAGGTEGAAQTGEEYRQELRKAIERFGKRIERLPWRMGSGMVKGDRAGFFFCAQVGLEKGARVYLRFVPREKKGEVVTELGTCLRLIECTDKTPTHMPPQLAAEAFDAWKVARASIYEAWTYETDPANLQPRVRPLNRQVAEFVRANASGDVDYDRLRRCLNALESPWSRRDENALRKVWEGTAGSKGEKVSVLLAEVERIGAQPFEAPGPLPPIQENEIHLVCWLAIEVRSS